MPANRFRSLQSDKVVDTIDLLERRIGERFPDSSLRQVAAELLSCLRKWESAGRITAADVSANFRDVLSMFPLRISTAEAFEIAFDLHARFSLSHWDSMLMAACMEAGVTTLYSEDLDPGTDFDGLTVVNPFR